MSRHILTPATAESIRMAVGALTAEWAIGEQASRDYTESVQQEMAPDRANVFLRIGATSVANILLAKLERFGFDPVEELANIAREWGIPTNLDLDGGAL